MSDSPPVDEEPISPELRRAVDELARDLAVLVRRAALEQALQFLQSGATAPGPSIERAVAAHLPMPLEGTQRSAILGALGVAPEGLTAAELNERVPLPYHALTRKLWKLVKRGELLTGGSQRARRYRLASAPVVLVPAPPTRPHGGAKDDDVPVLSLADIEMQHIRQTVETVRGNKSKAARMLGIDRRTLYRKLGREI